MDTILAARLRSKLGRLVPAVSNKLIKYEHKLAEVCSMMERTGFLLDVDYTSRLSERLHDDEVKYTNQAGKLGCENVNSTEQVADVLESRGVKITQKTPTGRRKVDKVLLDRLVDEGDEFAHAVVEAKKARKWRTTWVDGFLNQMDRNARCHAAINPLRARTARMSITGIPAQTLPAGDWLVRQCFIADKNQVIGSVDFQAQELRVLAALSGDTTMQQAFKDGDDLHQITANASGVDRKIGKMTNFLTVYGGGARNLAHQADIDLDLAKKVIAGFDKAYPKVKPFSKKLQREAQLKGEITTPLGRVLPVDKERPYAALNYMVQSTARDITCAGLIRLHEHGMTPYLRLPIHDEILVSVPEQKAHGAVRKIADIMSCTFQGVYMATDAEVGGQSWGSLYKKD
jgi:DNA polymerase-1